MYVDVADVQLSSVVQEANVSTVGSTYLIVALESFIGQFGSTPLETAATDAITAQATFLTASLSDGSGRYYDTVVLGGIGTSPSLDAQAAAVRGLYAAARVTQDATIRTAADEAYAVLMSDYFDADYGVFHTTAGSNVLTYTPRTVALVAGAMREASLEGNAADAAAVYTTFFQQVASKMQLSEGEATGETGADSDGDGIPFVPDQADDVPPIFATEAVFTL